KGILYALAAAVLFGASTPLAKMVLREVQPVLMAGLLYLGSGIGLSVYWLARSVGQSAWAREARLKKADWPWLAGAIAAGGGAGLAWAIDNDLTRKVSGGGPVLIAILKGLVAGGVNAGIGLGMGAKLPAAGTLLAMGVIGLFGYGASLTLFVLALRHIGAARTG